MFTVIRASILAAESATKYCPVNTSAKRYVTCQELVSRQKEFSLSKVVQRPVIKPGQYALIDVKINVIPAQNVQTESAMQR